MSTRPARPRAPINDPPPAAPLLTRLAALGLAGGLVLLVPSAADAATGEPVVLAVKTLPQVIAGLQAWVMGILFLVASLYGVLAALYLTTAGGDPEQVAKGKLALRNALGGYALAFLAPVLLQIVKSIVGG